MNPGTTSLEIPAHQGGNSGTSNLDENTIMSNDLLITSNNDGWDDAAAEAAERIIRGALLKFTESQWATGKENNPVEDGKRLLALGTAAGWVKWADGKPVEYRMRQPGRRLPDREELGDQNDEDWEAGPDGRPRDPWQSTRFVYLIDPATAEAFTFSTSSWGGRNAINDLGDQVQRMRFANPRAVPVVELRAAPMLTRFGRKAKPWFKVVAWRKGGNGDDGGAAPALIPPTTNSGGTEAEKVLDDAIPF